jgi:hypothetical protein
MSVRAVREGLEGDTYDSSFDAVDVEAIFL